jgi:hypothetical protein
MQYVGSPLERPARRRRAAQRLDLFTHGELVSRQITGKLRHFRGNDAAEHENAHESKENHSDDCKPAGHAAALQQPNEGREHEAQQNRQRDRDEDLATDIKRVDDDRRDDGARDPPHRPLILPDWRANNDG